MNIITEIERAKQQFELYGMTPVKVMVPVDRLEELRLTLEDSFGVDVPEIQEGTIIRGLCVNIYSGGAIYVL